ncbi:Ornithine aminotransferase [Aduncisulcus paluster]|uniref:Ornithine aminotransferase n=1 Tax=Aduncisulcus paluster TaxID=2918883 RepID=A0ABQ5KQJ7_9EUKA|nr:Ornithine aminotransferase [Aduncisulcus paluster]|eukprot:gnl/Carplike_NY0171/310_a429_2765.p1 GENE.gnl/Carplike_NY0171/310_a429_2765~~gnl/Carplike_NY0171/310_a429_2765.p1  ORF type:complete len:433 (+),score=167.52 gnl/Carplike_NY0171/310_a429_2765:124-1422(+)
MSQEAIKLEKEFCAHNYHPLPVVFDRGEGAYIYNPEGVKYIDCLAGYSALNQGHRHPKIIAALKEQADKLTLSARAFYSTGLGSYAKLMSEIFADKIKGEGDAIAHPAVLPMNTGAEAVESSLKIARRWGYEKKGIPEGKAMIVCAEGNFHGRTIAVISMSVDPECREGFGPFVPEILTVPYDNAEALEKVFDQHGKNICAYICEPIQGEAGIYVPADGYLKKVRELCDKHNILWIDDEIQAGIARTGKMLCAEHDGAKPDIVTLGKAISGGVFPVSAVICRKEVMSVITPGSHGSTYGGCSLGCAVAKRAMEVVLEEKLSERSAVLGERLQSGLRAIDSPMIDLVRGKGLMVAVVFKDMHGKQAWDLCCLLAHKYQILCKPTHSTIIRITPPLVISEEDIDYLIECFGKAIKELEEMKVEELDEKIPIRKL